MRASPRDGSTSSCERQDFKDCAQDLGDSKGVKEVRGVVPLDECMWVCV
jgi:hypothetical protein